MKYSMQAFRIFSFSLAVLISVNAQSARPKECENVFHAAHGTMENRFQRIPLHPDDPFTGDKVRVRIESVHYSVEFDRTNRGIKTLGKFYPPEVLRIKNFEGKRVLDVGTGDGRFVKELREQGIDAMGVDIVLRPEQKELPYFQEADARKLPFADGSVDQVFATHTIFSDIYHKSWGASDIALEGAREIARVLKSGGVAYLAHFYYPHTKWLDSLLREFPKLRATFARSPEGDSIGEYFLKLEKLP